jgi:hypothetical protein
LQTSLGNISKPTLIAARNDLIKCGLISYESSGDVRKAGSYCLHNATGKCSLPVEDELVNVAYQSDLTGKYSLPVDPSSKCSLPVLPQNDPEKPETGKSDLPLDLLLTNISTTTVNPTPPEEPKPENESEPKEKWVTLLEHYQKLTGRIFESSNNVVKIKQALKLADDDIDLCINTVSKVWEQMAEVKRRNVRSFGYFIPAIEEAVEYKNVTISEAQPYTERHDSREPNIRRAIRSKYTRSETSGEGQQSVHGLESVDELTNKWLRRADEFADKLAAEELEQS